MLAAAAVSQVRPSVFFTEDDFSVARGGGSGKSGAMPPTAESPRAARGGSGTPLGATGPALAICAPVLAQADGEHGDWLEYTDDYGTLTPGRAEALGRRRPTPRAHALTRRHVAQAGSTSTTG